MSIKSKESAKTAKSTGTVVSRKGNSLCLVKEQDPYRNRKVGGTIRKQDGSMFRYSKYDKPPGQTTVQRYPLTASRREAEQRAGGMS